MSRDRRALIILTGLILITSLPFVNRAYFVDDYYFVTMAKGILANPWRPYDFKSDDAGIANVGWERGQRPRMVNPPLFHYYLAGVMAIFGDAAWKLRTASLLFSFLALFSMYFLGKRLTPDPLAAAILMAVTPAYWLTSYSLLIDSALVAFLLTSLLAFFIGQEKKNLGWIMASGFLMGLTVLVKYFGVIVVPLALAWQLLDAGRRRWKPGYVACIVFLAVQILWAAWNISTYGQSHFLAALPRGMSSPSVVAWAQKALVLASFIGGSTLFVLASADMLWRLSKAWVGGVLATGMGLYMLFSSRAGGFDRVQSLLLSIFIAGTLSYLVVMGRLLKPDENKKEAFLILWVLLGMLELVIVMPWTAGRYLLCVLPAMCWVFVLVVHKLKLRRFLLTTIGATFLIGFLVAHGDYVQANTIVTLASALQAKAAEFQKMAPKPKRHWYYLADTFDGSQPYLLPLGWENVLPHQKFKRGDLFLRAYYRKSSWWNVDEELKHFRPVMVLEVRSKNPIRVMDVPASAGFYASCWGALPWTITNHPLERFELYQAISQ
jgi:dolichyl-phosphate-mannose-protein mannosyltransferase